MQAIKIKDVIALVLMVAVLAQSQCSPNKHEPAWGKVQTDKEKVNE